MSINATIHTDPEIAGIRSLVASKTDGIPFTLFPVRIETRFMKVDKPLFVRDPFTAAVIDISKLTRIFIDDPRDLPRPVLEERYKAAGEIAKGLTEKIKSVSRLNLRDKEILKDNLKTLEAQLKLAAPVTLNVKAGKQATDQRSKAANIIKAADDTPVSNQLQTLHKELLAQTRAAQLEANRLLANPEAKHSDTADFITSLDSINQSIQSIAAKKLTNLDYKGKRKAFADIEAKLAHVEKEIPKTRQAMASNMTATPEQMKRLKKVMAALNPSLSILNTDIPTLSSEYKKAEYRMRMKKSGEKLGKLKAEIETLVQPKLEMRSDLRTIDAREILFQSNEVLLALQKANAAPMRTLKAVKTFRDKLYKKLHKLRDDAHKIIEGNAEDLDAIQATWQETDQQLETFTTYLKALGEEKPKEQAAYETIAGHLESEYRRDLAGLKPGKKSGIPKLTNKILETNVKVYEETIAELKRLDARITAGQGSENEKERFEKLVPELQALDKKFTADARELHILPEKKLAELKQRSAALEEKVLKKQKELGIFSTDARKAAEGIRSTADMQVADVLDRKDRFYADDRASIVFAERTVTKKELWVRIYPDDISIHTHEEALTQAEADSGTAYWYEIWAAGADKEAKLAAWRAISTAYGSERAAWIVRSLEPVSIATLDPVFNSLSEKLLGANNSLKEMDALLGKGIKERKDIFDVLHELTRPLKAVEKSFDKIESEGETLLRTTRKLLLKVQAQLGQYFETIRKLKDEDKKKLSKELEMAKQVGEAFSKVIDQFKTIRPAKAAEINKRITEHKVFPKVQIKDKTWTEAPHSRVMPDRFVVIAMRGSDFLYLEAGKPLPEDQLVVGLDPATFDSESFSYDADKNLIVADSIKWLTDFKTALEIGMAISFELTDEDWDEGFDKIFVLGIRDTSASQGKKLIEDLIDNHHYLPEGASFLQVGTPTNNTKSGESGYRSFETDASLSFAVERNSEEADTYTPDPDYPSDSERLAAALGVKHSVFHHLDYSATAGVSDALNMNKALYHGTLGAYLEEGMDTLFNLDNINRTKKFFTKYVSGRGYLPSIRVGTQPYGILPTTAFSRFAYTANDNLLPQLTELDFNNTTAIESQLQTRYEIRLKNLLNLLRQQWATIRDTAMADGTKQVKHAGNMSAAPDPQAYFMEMLGLDATSVEQYLRYGLNVAARQGAGEIGEFSINFLPGDPFGPINVNDTFRWQVLSGYYYQSDNFPDEGDPAYTIADTLNRIKRQFEEARVFYIRHLQDQAQLLGDEIDHRELSEELQTPDSSTTGTPEERYLARDEVDFFVDWILNQNPWDVHAGNIFSELTEADVITAGMPSKSILFLLLRHSLLSAYADTMLKILEKEGLVGQKLRKSLGQARNYLTAVEGHMNYVTKWNYFFGKLPPLRYVLGNNMNIGNPFYVYMAQNNYYLNRYLSPAHPTVFTNYSGHGNHTSLVNELNETKDAIRKLKEIPTAHLDHLVSEHLDLCSYRMDAWCLGMVNKRLDEQRQASANGSFIGAYGWVENLRRGADLVPAHHLPSGLWKSGDDPVYTDADIQGYIHTPSLNHAITAAILRAGFKANSSIAEVENQMAVNLSSERVRTGLNLLNGIRNGQETGALLGYQFERGLHERYLHVPLELDEYIYDFRELFPANPPVSGTSVDEEVARNMVVNGMDLLEYAQEFVEDQGGPLDNADSLYQSLKNYEAAFWTALGNANLSAATAAKKDAMLREIDRMADAFDALGDLCISESVYQVAQGNHVRASAILDKLAKGDVPTEITITDTPRTGTVLTQKVALFIDRIAALDQALTESNTEPISGAAIDAAVTTANAQAGGWTSRFTPRALLEPTLNKWAGALIGDPSHIKCMAEYTVETEDSKTVTPVTVTLAELNVQPLDVLHLFATGAMNGGTELNVRIANYVRAQIGPLPVEFTGTGEEEDVKTVDDVPVRIRYTERDETWGDDDFSFYEKSGYLLAIRQLLTSSGILTADHLHIPGEEEVSQNDIRNQDVDELLIRVTNAQARLQKVFDDLDTFFTNEVDAEDYASHDFTHGQIDALRAIMTAAAGFGIPASLPEIQVGYGKTRGKTLTVAAIGLYNALLDRLQRAEKEITKGKNTALANDPRVDALVQAARIMMEASFRIWPQFTVRNAAELAEQLTLTTAQGLLRSAAPHAVDSWMQGLGRVRERMAGLDTLQMMVENFDTPLPEAIPVQFPFTLDGSGNATDHWLALPYPSGYTPAEDKLSLVLMNSAAVTAAPADPKVALIIDEWVEIIPNLEETTGLTFNYDQPDAKAPNTILLAVTPRITGNWSWDDLVYTLRDTLELSKSRAVEPEHLENTVFGQIVPGILTEIVPPQLLPDPTDPAAQDNPLGYQVVTDFKVNNDTYETEETES